MVERHFKRCRVIQKYHHNKARFFVLFSLVCDTAHTLCSPEFNDSSYHLLGWLTAFGLVACFYSLFTIEHLDSRVETLKKDMVNDVGLDEAKYRVSKCQTKDR